MLRSNNIQNRAGHNVGLTLALIGLMCAVTLVLCRARLASAQAVGANWSYTGNLNTARESHTATLLPNGKVLVAGGDGNAEVLSSAELYDPVTGTWSNTGNLNTGVTLHTATLLPNGKILVAGGGDHGPLNNAQLYDPATGTWNNTGNLNTARLAHTATLLSDGRVLVAGGFTHDALGSTSAELYDPATETWTSTGNLNTGRESHTATLLPSGKVLVMGGFSNDDDPLSSAELYDPATGTWSSTGSLNTVHGIPTATLLPSGKVLVVDVYSNLTELYDAATGTWSFTASLNTTARGATTATLLPSGKVLAVGGYGNLTPELYDPASGTWSFTPSLNTVRGGHTATLLPSGKVLVAAGTDNFSGHSTNTAELYDPGINLIVNQIDDAQFFVRQQYRDFLNREPEAEGLQFYLNILNGCAPTDSDCLKFTRGALSANFFRSPEFQRKGNYVMYLYMVSIGQRPVTAAELSGTTKVDRPHYSEFIADLASISTPNDDPALTEVKKDALAVAWLQRAEIQSKYGGLSNDQFVKTLESTAGVTLSNEDQLIANLNNGSSRASVLRAVAESPEVNDKFYKQSFVTMEYFGYLRRDPESCFGSSEPANCGYIFHNSRFQLAADPDFLENTIVRGFIESAEYRQRFGP